MKGIKKSSEFASYVLLMMPLTLQSAINLYLFEDKGNQSDEKGMNIQLHPGPWSNCATLLLTERSVQMLSLIFVRFFQYEKMHDFFSEASETTPSSPQVSAIAPFIGQPKENGLVEVLRPKKHQTFKSMGIFTAFIVDYPYVCLGKSYVYLCGLCFGWMCLQLRQRMRLCFKYFQAISYLLIRWAWNLQRRPFVMTLANITGDGLDHSQNCLSPIHSSPMNLGFRCLLDRSSLDCRQRQKGCRAWETLQRLKIAQKYVSYFVYVRIINVLDIDISMAFVIISFPGKTCQFSPIFFPTFCWSKDSYESCWTFCGPTTLWPKNMLALMKQKPRGVEASNCWDS